MAPGARTSVITATRMAPPQNIYRTTAGAARTVLSVAARTSTAPAFMAFTTERWIQGCPTNLAFTALLIMRADYMRRAPRD